MKLNISLLLLLLYSYVLKAEKVIAPTQSKKTDSLIIAFLKNWNITGANIAITKDEKLIYNKGFGFSDKNKNTPVQTYHQFRIASVSKPVTAIAIMKLIEEGKLSLNDTVFGPGKILDSPYYLQTVSDKRIYLITVQHLLEHTAGWDRRVPCDGYAHNDPAFFPLHVTEVLDAPNPVGDSTLIKFSLLKGLNFDPGAKYAYSNIGYLVLGKVIEKLTGDTYENYVKNKILQPLGIYSMHLGKNLMQNDQKEVEYINDHTTLSCYGDGKFVPWQYGGFNLEAMNAHGGWVATASDLTKLMLAVDGASQIKDILHAETIALMNTPSIKNSNYAKGWSVNSYNSWHTGSLDGTASFICKTKDGYTWAFLLNSRNENNNAFWSAFDRLPWDCVNALEEKDQAFRSYQPAEIVLMFQQIADKFM